MLFSQIRQQGRVVLGLWALLVLTGLGAAYEGRWSLSFVAVATLGLAMAPVILAKRYDITLPLPFVAAITLFLIASIFMGEAFDFYERVWWWDIALHGSSAIGFGLIGFVFVLMMFEGDRFAAPQWAMCLLAFGIAVTVGTTWEIFEFAMDNWFGLNMQKSGLDDTMGDLIVDVLGAAFAVWLGYVYLRAKDRSFWTWPIDRFVALNKRLFRKHR
ncbi:hypothetical protein [Yoonia sediminilitoris]|uniref:Membrane protein YjdF n=1 Tax=Yoonia sediminilitoris TaxID=1286148 RepID=A0A2T6KIV2_9RHOB|nr:hypothetical protein [Yoonia sediminilitoris]PUB15655.1 hypothetical protein C8N45_104275 [Yoonia sediminilitoris]RCW96264.1 hypothetical protein DFP92_104274 [Yoonia sediminilitoris]